MFYQNFALLIFSHDQFFFRKATIKQKILTRNVPASVSHVVLLKGGSLSTNYLSRAVRRLFTWLVPHSGCYIVNNL